jgi:hypothetical protein
MIFIVTMCLFHGGDPSLTNCVPQGVPRATMQRCQVDLANIREQVQEGPLSADPTTTRKYVCSSQQKWSDPPQ